MPTQQVDPGSGELLQEVANALLKSRKVIVVTGAGISTNSGIPDFRSENGLYSLIQTQLDAAERRERNLNSGQDQTASTTADTDTSHNDRDDDSDDERASKRRRTSRHGSVEVTPEKEIAEASLDVDLPCLPNQPARNEDALFLPPLRPADMSTPLRPEFQYRAATPPLPSPAPHVWSSAYRVKRMDFLRSSSPLSSLPAFMSDPFAAPSDTESCSSSRRSSISADSETGSDEAEDSFLSQKKLPRMKGKDLFDASIWADPVRTQVFYSFATTLRQKSRDCVPTTSHRFISHLKSRGKLVRCYTQNIDRIEEKVGLSTELKDGPGSRGRFSRKSTGNTHQLAKMVEEAKELPPSSQLSSQPTSSQRSASQPTLSSQQTSEGSGSKVPASHCSGVECVYLHGSLEQLRCFQCKRTSSWDNMEDDTLSGLQPECPHCTEATAAREERGKRALGVGKLRPDIVLYGEDHPNSHLISPLVEHDIKLNPDVLLILGTSLKVHGLKTLVREFANAIHNKNGKVVFVNFTKPPESIWSDFIDYWVQWDCDAWVADLQMRVPKLWASTEAPKASAKAPPKNPVCFRDVRDSGAHLTRKIHHDLFRITGTPMRQIWQELEAVQPVQAVKAAVVAPPPPEEEVTVTSDVGAPTANTDSVVNTETEIKPKAKPKPKRVSKPANPRRTRKSAPATVQQPTPQPSSSPSRSQPHSSPPPSFEAARHSLSSILDSVKNDPRTRKRKKIDGHEVILPIKLSKPRRDLDGQEATPPTEVSEHLRHTLAPIKNPAQLPTPADLDRRLKAMEPMSPPSGPIQTLPSKVRGITQNIFQKAGGWASTWAAPWPGLSNLVYDGRTRSATMPYQFGGGLRPSGQQITPPELSKETAQGHNAKEKDAAKVMAEMRAPRRVSTRPKLPR